MRIANPPPKSSTHFKIIALVAGAILLTTAGTAFAEPTQDELRQKISNLETQLNVHTQNMTSIEAKITEINNNIAQQNTDLQNAVNKIALLQNTTAPVTNDYQQGLIWLTSGLETALKNIGDSRVELKETKREMKGIDFDREKLKELKQSLKLQEKKLKKTTKAMGLNEKHKMNLELHGGYQDKVEELTEKIKKQQKKIKKFNKAIDKIKDEIAKLVPDKKKELEAKANNNREDIGKYKKQIGLYEIGINVANNIKSQTDELTKYQGMLEKVRSDIAEANAEIAKARAALS